MEAKALAEEEADRKLEERRARQARRQALAQGDTSVSAAAEAAVGGEPESDAGMTTEEERLTLRDLEVHERRLLKESVADLAALNQLLAFVHAKRLASTETEERSAAEAVANADEAGRSLDQALKLAKQLRTKLRGSGAARVRALLPLPLRNFLGHAARPLLELWREGL